MSKLLTEQELSDKVVEILGIRNDLQRHHVLSGAIPTLVKLIQSQKQAHADMVIGEDSQHVMIDESISTDRCDYLKGGACDCPAGTENDLKREQRDRNKS